MQKGTLAVTEQNRNTKKNSWTRGLSLSKGLHPVYTHPTSPAVVFFSIVFGGCFDLQLLDNENTHFSEWPNQYIGCNKITGPQPRPLGRPLPLKRSNSDIIDFDNNRCFVAINCDRGCMDSTASLLKLICRALTWIASSLPKNQMIALCIVRLSLTVYSTRSTNQRVELSAIHQPESTLFKAYINLCHKRLPD